MRPEHRAADAGGPPAPAANLFKTGGLTLAIQLTPYERDMLAGKYGEDKQRALEIIIDYAHILGAQELVEVSKAHFTCGNPPDNESGEYDYFKAYSDRYLDHSGRIRVKSFNEGTYVMDDVSACDAFQWAYCNQDESLYRGNESMIRTATTLGAVNGGTCAPYLAGWLPIMGEYFVTTESSNVLYCNSILGARGNGGGENVSYAAAVCGRAPRWGLHLPENRHGTHVFNIRCASATKQDWDLIGYAVGKRLAPNAVPVLRGDFQRPNLIKLKSCFTSMATTSSAELCLIVGVSPEAQTFEMAMQGHQAAAEYDITQDIIDGYRRELCHPVSGPVDFLQIGCPNCSCEELAQYARYMKGKHVKEGVRFCIFTNIAQHAIAKRSGIIDTLNAAGVQVLTSGCILRTFYLADRAKGIGLSAVKLTHYSKTERKDTPVYFGTDEEVMDAAVSGYWEVKA